MNFAQKLSLKIFFTGIAILTVALIIVYINSYKNILTNELEHAQLIVDEISVSIDQNIIEKVKTTEAIALAPVITTALDKSNAHYSSLSKPSRSEEIQSQNERWKATEDHNDLFILEYTDNQVSRFLKQLQKNIKGEYGEIFLTNKYGALVASTAKLTTLAHANKYWWEGAYNDGAGAVFFDDRGYDESVGGYVLGVVVPVKKGDEIIGILKVNLNVLGALSDLISYVHNDKMLKSHEEHSGVIKLIRSGGLIVLEEGVEPLSERIPVELDERLKAGNKGSFIFEQEDKDFIIVMSEIGFTSNIEGFHFGGDFESIDHKKGNCGESWIIVNLLPMSNVVVPLNNTLGRLSLIGILLSFILAIIALIIGKRTAKPIKDLMRQTEQIAKGDFDSRVYIKRKDELGLLAVSFNNMVLNLKDTTTSIDRLNAEIKERKRAEQSLKENEKQLRELNSTKDKFFSIIAHDLKSPFNSLLGFTDLFLENYDSFDDEERKLIIESLNNSSKKTYLLLENLLTWSCSQTGSIEFSPEEIQIKTLIHEVISLSQPAAENKSIGLFDKTDADIFVYADKNMLQTVFRNLITNAIKFTRKEGIVIISANKPNKQGFVEISVSDTGIGIPDTIIDDLFLIDKNISTPGTEKEQGTGLGLILCKEFVEKQGGEISVESEIGKGSKIIFTLPEVLSQSIEDKCLFENLTPVIS
jgi:signal transduction histidine kinase